MKNEIAVKSIHKVHTIDSEITKHVAQIEKLKQDLADKRYLRLTLRRQFDFIKTQKEADQLQELADLYPEITAGRQLQVIFHILKFKTNKEIADVCFVDEKTIKFHKTRLFKILRCAGEKGLHKEHALRLEMKLSPESIK